MLFDVVDLYEANDIAKVVASLHLFGSCVQKAGRYDGPALGADRDSTEWWAHELAMPESGCVLLAQPGAIFPDQPLLHRAAARIQRAWRARTASPARRTGRGAKAMRRASPWSQHSAVRLALHNAPPAAWRLVRTHAPKRTAARDALCAQPQTPTCLSVEHLSCCGRAQAT